MFDNYQPNHHVFSLFLFLLFYVLDYPPVQTLKIPTNAETTHHDPTFNKITHTRIYRMHSSQTHTIAINVNQIVIHTLLHNVNKITPQKNGYTWWSARTDCCKYIELPRFRMLNMKTEWITHAQPQQTHNICSDTHNVDQSHAGTTLANLKKQRAQSRNSAVASENGSLIATPSIAMATTNSGMCNTGSTLARNSLGPSMEMSFLSSSTNDLMHVESTPTITKFSGVTSDVVSDSTRSRRCCIVM